MEKVCKFKLQVFYSQKSGQFPLSGVNPPAVRRPKSTKSQKIGNRKFGKK